MGIVHVLVGCTFRGYPFLDGTRFYLETRYDYAILLILISTTGNDQ